MRGVGFIPVMLGMAVLSTGGEVGHAHGRQEVMSLVYHRQLTGSKTENHTVVDVIYTFTPTMTRVIEAGREDYIDYADLRLYRYSDDLCRIYELEQQQPTIEQSDADDRVRQQLKRAMGDVEVTDGGTAKTVQGYRAMKKKVVWGGKMMQMRTIGPQPLDMYGQQFLPVMEEYVITSAIDRIDDLFQLAAEHEPVYRANPLLRRLDPLGLLVKLQGVPIEISGPGYRQTLSEVRIPGSGYNNITLPGPCTDK